MPKLRRRVVAASVALLLAASAAPANAGPGPQIVSAHDSYVPARAFDMSSSAYGTVFASDAGNPLFGEVYLAPAPVSTSTPMIDLGPRTNAHPGPSISGTQVAVPQAPGFDSPIPTTVKYCATSTCATGTSVFTVPAGYRYIGNAEDRAILYKIDTKDIALAQWTGAITHDYPLSIDYDEAPTAVGDAGGIAVSGQGEMVYITRAGTTTMLDYGNEAVLTPSYVVWYALGVGEPSYDQTRIYRVPLSAPGTAPTTVVSLAGAPGLDTITANDSGLAWLESNDDGSNRLYTMAWTATSRTLYARPIDSSTGLSGSEGGNQFLVSDTRAAVPGLYRVSLGGTTGTLAALLPTRGAITYGMAISHNRAAFVDDTTYDHPAFVRDVTNGVPGAEQTVATRTGTDDGPGSIGLSGPFLAYTRAGTAPNTTDVVYGPVGGPYGTKTYPMNEVGRVSVSGRRVVVTGGTRSRLIDVLSGGVSDLGTVYAAAFGDFVATLNYNTGRLEHKNLVTGAIDVVRPGPVAGCTSFCVDEEFWSLNPWGHELVFAFKHGGSSPGTAKGRWNANTNALSLLPAALTTDNWYELRYWAGLLQVYFTDFTVKLFDLNGAATAIPVAANADAPMGLDGNVVGWRSLDDLRTWVRHVQDFVPGHVAQPRHLASSAPTAFGPGLATPTWDPRMFVSQDVDWTLELYQGGTSGPLAKSWSGTSTYGEIRLPEAWNGTNDVGGDLPHGTYTWVLTGDSTAGTSALRSADGLAPSITGTVLLSRTAPATKPTVAAPTLASDVSTTATFPVTWTAPPAGLRTTVQRSVNGGAFATVLSSSTATSLSTAGAVGSTYRFRAAHVDAAGRLGPWSIEDFTTVPYDDRTRGAAYGGAWSDVTSSLRYLSSHHYASAAGATYSFTSTGTAIYLVGGKGAGYGQFQVSIDGGAYSAAIDTYASSTQYRKVLYTKTGLTNASHSIKVRVVGTAGRPIVSIDGVGYKR